MKQKKKIDDIYREGLKNAETPPPPDSWEFISARLPEEKKRRVLPLWIPLAGVAAMLALLITVFNFNLFDTPVPNPVVNEEENFESNTSPASEITEEPETSIAGTEKEVPKDVNSKAVSSEAVASEDSSPQSAPGKVNNSEAKALAENERVSKYKRSGSAKPQIAETDVAENIQSESFSGEKISNRPAENSTPAEAIAEVSGASEMLKETKVLKKEFKDDLLREESDYAEVKPEAIPGKNEGFLKRFRISTTAGAVYFNMGNNNTVDAQFAENAGGSDVSMSYGVNLAYKVSEKVKIRSGVSKLNFNYSTRQVDYSAASSSSAVRTDPAGMGIMLAAQGDLEQEFGFIEIPLEIEFALIDKKIGLNLIGGASTLLLEENSLSMSTPAFTTDFGEAQNLNEISFSANLGLGVYYNFSPKIRLNLEPMFKYQLNTFDHGNSHYFGIYSGLSYQF